MDRRRFIKSCAVGLGALGSGYLSGCGKSGKSELPNIVVILADDMGYGDIHAYNPESRIPTPNLDGLAADGVRFTDAHSGSSVCTPTRYGLLTGRYAWRTWLKKGVLFPPKDKPLIDTDRLTVAGLLKKQGYMTDMVGKWHLGFGWAKDEQGEVDFNKPLNYGPTDSGFDSFFGIAGSLDMIPYGFYKDHEPYQPFTREQPELKFPHFVRKGPKAEGFEPVNALDDLTKQAVSVIEKRAADRSPFFLYFAMTAPHKPAWPHKRFEGKTGLGPYADFVHQTDWTVGQVLDALERTGTADNTLVIYTSDNGSYMYRREAGGIDHVTIPTNQGYSPENHKPNGDWRGTKADVWEGGHRVPFIVRWPGKAAANSTCKKIVCLTDIMATCAEAAGIALPDSAGEDSFSLVPLVQGKDWSVPRAPVINHSIDGMFAVRDGRWKMVFGNGSGGREKPKGEPFGEPYVLYDLANDPGETTNVLHQHPDIAQQLTSILQRIRQSGGSKHI